MVVGIDDENYRVLDDDLEPFLYSKKLFTVVDHAVPDDWIREDYEDGEYHIYPSEFREHIFENYFDGKPYAVSVFNSYVEKHKLKGMK